MDNNDHDLLIIEDDPSVLQLLRETLADEGFTLRTAETVAAARAELTVHSFRVVLSDHNLPDGCGVDLLAEMQGSGRRIVSILMTGLPDLNVAVEAINRGNVYKFVTKPLDLAALVSTIRRALEHYESLCEHDHLRKDVLDYNRRLKLAATEMERSLQAARDRIRSEELTVEKQKACIETLSAELQNAYLDMVTSLTAAVEAKDPYTKGHSDRVFYYCSLMADVLGLSDEARHDLRFASVLHDLGKIGVPDQILNKPGPLLPDEHRIMASHIFLTDNILKSLPFLTQIRRIVREHHERFNGSGYPNGLRGTQISLEGRILAVADAFDAMRSHRAYRKAMSTSEAAQELRSGSGTQFCPLCVGAFILSLENRGDFPAEGQANEDEAPTSEEYLVLRNASDPVHINTLFG